MKALVLFLNSYPKVVFFNIFQRKYYSEFVRVPTLQFIPLPFRVSSHPQEITGKHSFVQHHLGSEGAGLGWEELPATLAWEGGEGHTVLCGFNKYKQGTDHLAVIF